MTVPCFFDSYESQLRQCINDMLREIENLRSDAVECSNSSVVEWCDTMLVNTRDEYGDVLESAPEVE